MTTWFQWIPVTQVLDLVVVAAFFRVTLDLVFMNWLIVMVTLSKCFLAVTLKISCLITMKMMLDRLKAPKASNLARKRKVQSNPPVGMKQGKKGRNLDLLQNLLLHTTV